MKDHHFSFPIDPNRTDRVSHLNDLLGTHLAELLDLIIPISGGSDQRIEAFRLLNDRDTIYPLPSTAKNNGNIPGILDIYEPRIGYIRNLLESMLRIVDVEKDGEIVTIDGFRLRHLEHWLSPSSGASDILAHAASVCRLDCEFCYNKGSMPPLQPHPRQADDVESLFTRISHYVPNGKLGLFHCATSPCEALDHPNIKDILGCLREKTDELIRIPTHGATLTDEMVDFLARLAPVSLDVSLNSASISRRQWLMKDPEPRIALDSLSLLQSARIPFTVVIVPWPFPSESTMIEDLGETVRFAARHDATHIQISLPGYTRGFSCKTLFDQEGIWKAIKQEAMILRDSVSCPIVLRPGIVEEYDDPIRMDLPLVAGVVKNSPADRSGLAAKDCIERINGLKIKSRVHARALLNTIHQSDMHSTSLSVRRDGSTLDLTLKLNDHDYPYTRETDHHLGVVFPFSGIPQEWFENIERAIAAHQGQNILILSSPLVEPYMAKHLPENGCLSGRNIYLRVPRNNYFGGNISMGDLLVVEDFILAISDFIDREGLRPDLVLIPSSPFHLSGWGRDLTGRVYLDIERHTNVKVALIECDPIYD
ncbi:MAG: radical SAM protein [Desulfobacterales bacterium]